VLLALTVAPRFWLGTFVFGWLMCGFALVAFEDRDKAGRTYVFRVGRETVRVDSAGILGARHWEWKREGVRDVRLVSGKRWVLWFDLTPAWRNRHVILLSLSRNDLLVLVNALREGLGLPPQTLPE
jgi:hypothetical protein